MHFSVNKFKVDINDCILSGNEQQKVESCHNLKHYFESALCWIMLSQLEYIVLCPVNLSA